MNKKRYLLLIDALGSGGAERQMGYLATELRRAGHVVKLCTFYNTANFYTEDLKKKGIDIETRLDGSSPIHRPFVIRKLVRSFKPDMVIAYKRGAAMGACLARYLCKFRLTVSERNTTQQLTRGEKLKFNLYKKADHIVPNSFSQADFIKTHFPKLMPKVTVITNMIDTERFKYKERNQENSPLKVITVGRIMPQKNLENYVKAVSILKQRGVNVKFDWYGAEDKNNPQYKVDILDLARQLNVDDAITFYDPKTNIEREYENHDIFLLPSLYEGFPNVLCEAMMCGLPAVTTAVCDSPRIMTDKRFHANPQSPESIADALQCMLELPSADRKRIGMENHMRIVELCAPKSFLEKYIELN